MDNSITESTIMRELREQAASTGQSELARRMDISPQLMCDVLKRRRKFGHKILDHLGYREVVTYVRKRKPN